MVKSTIQVSDVSIDTFIGRGVLLNYEAQSVIDLTDDLPAIKEGDIVVIHTGLSSLFGTPSYYDDHPILTEAFCRYLIDKKIKGIALDFYSPDTAPFNRHKQLLEADLFIAENLNNTHLLKPFTFFDCFIIPVKISASGAFVRAFAHVK
jgi:kynurenine formamidase